MRSGALACYIAVTGALLAPAVQAEAMPATRSSLVVSEAIRSDNLSLFPKWTEMTVRYGQQKNVAYPGCHAKHLLSCRLDEWSRLIGAQRGRPLQAQLEAINSFGNAHPYILDQVNWGMSDFWETPIEFLDLSGDCEDYAIFKYYSLRRLGVPASKLRIIIVQDLNLGGIVHAVLSVSDGERSYILDNQIKQVIGAESVYHYKPIYSINETAWWLYPPE